MRKIDSENENFIDNFLLDIAEYVSPFFYKHGFSPNDITTLSLITGLICIYYLNTKNIVFFVVFFIVSYFLDCLDGFFARKYNMVSKLGDNYDHITDTVIYILYVITIMSLYYNNRYIAHIFVIYIILVWLSFLQLTCQQILYSGMDTKDETLDKYIYIFEFLGISGNKCHNIIKFTKYFGSGTLKLFYIILVIFLEKSTNKK